MSRKIKIEKRFRISQINLAISYVYAADAISQEIKTHRDWPDKEWRNQVMIIPMLFLLRQALELALKSIFVSHDKEFEAEHDLKKLTAAVESVLKEGSRGVVPFNEKRWEGVVDVAVDFAETKYSGKRMFSNDDTSSDALRYLQTDASEKYSELKNVKHEEIIKRVKQAVILCEAFTLNTETISYYIKRSV